MIVWRLKVGFYELNLGINKIWIRISVIINIGKFYNKEEYDLTWDAYKAIHINFLKQNLSLQNTKLIEYKLQDKNSADTSLYFVFIGKKSLDI